MKTRQGPETDKVSRVILGELERVGTALGENETPKRGQAMMTLPVRTVHPGSGANLRETQVRESQDIVVGLFPFQVALETSI